MVSSLSQGYFQGINSIVGMFILCGLNEFQTYTYSKYFLLQLNLKQLYENGFEETKRLAELTENLVRVHLPSLHKRFVKTNVNMSVVIFKWFLTCFTEYLSTSEVSSLLDRSS